MIVFNLKCRKDHVFEAWFRDSASYDAQAEAGDLACPTCGSREIEKALMAPRLGRSGKSGHPGGGEPNQKAVMETQQAGEAMKALRGLREKIERTCDYVGPSFAEEARKIHYGETDPRNIYGETSSEDAEALKEEGVSFGRVPWAPDRDS
jgi:hypothetical protein